MDLFIDSMQMMFSTLIEAHLAQIINRFLLLAIIGLFILQFACHLNNCAQNVCTSPYFDYQAIF